MSTTNNKTINITPLFQRVGLDDGTVSILETPGMYPYKERVEDNWAYYSAFGFKELKARLMTEGKTIQHLGIVGIGSGVEGILAAQVFSPELRELVISDVDNEVLQGAVQNIKSAAQGIPMQVTPVRGSFAEPMMELPSKVDILFGNIPNLPATGNEDLSLGPEKGTFLAESLYAGYQPPQKYIQWALGAQYAYIQSSRKALVPGGSVVTELGGRVPLPIIKDLFTENGFNIQEVLVGFKEQTEALMDFGGYYRFEKEYGVEFDFYLYKESLALMQERGLSNPVRGLGGEEFKLLLSPYKVTAGQAIELYNRGIAVGHMVHIFRGIKQ
jgi:hypothetical protein